MDPSLSDQPNPLVKIIWENLFQILAMGFLLIVIIINWSSTDANIQIGVTLLILVYLMLRATFLIQGHKFTKKIEKMKEEERGSSDESLDLYEKSLR